MAGRIQELPGLSGKLLHKPGGRRAAVLYGYAGRYLDIFYQVLDYCKTYFADEYGEWYGFLRRDGKSTLPACKGSTFKSPFHVPRCLIMVDQMMGQILGV